ncbi:MAG TPA: hypothetical protein VFU88_09500 [Ktedonobacterales bacterium]|nr:hypothetical protein [Ktedonobacterales bacterium]
MGEGKRRWWARRAGCQGRRRALVVALPLLLVILATLAGCADAGGAGTASTGRVSATTTPAATTTPSSLPSVTPIIITDLGAFRQQLTGALGSGSWERFAPLLSPQLTFQRPSAGGAKIEMPAAAQDLKSVISSNTPWRQAAQREVDIHSCYAGTTPKNQQMGFDGGTGIFLLVGIGRWQGYWVVAWVFEDPLGGGNGCSEG